jgi:hypothetical protein
VDQESDKIKQYIEMEREKLGHDLHEIEDRVKRAVDPKGWFDRNPGLTMGAVAAGGFVLALITARSTAYPSTAYPKTSGFLRESSQPTNTSSQMHQIGDTLDKTFAALIGVVSGKFREFVADAVPGFREQYRDVEQRGRPNIQQVRASGEETRGRDSLG